MKIKKISVDIKTAQQLEELRVSNDWSWKELYAYYSGMGVENASEVVFQDADALRKQVERKKHKIPHEEIVGTVLESKTLTSDKSIQFDVKDDTIVAASGTVQLDLTDDIMGDSRALVAALFTEFNLDPSKYELIQYTPTISGRKFKVSAKFKMRAGSVYDSEAIAARYDSLLKSAQTISMAPIYPMDVDNIFIVNLADVHWNKLPHIGFDGTYLDNFEKMVYTKIRELIEYSKATPISRAVVTIGHDFFQTNDGRGTTKKGTPVSNIMEYEDMFDTGVRILANCIKLIADHYMVDAYYVLANHDADASWHASRELKMLFRDVPHINVIVDKLPFHYVEWGSSLVELVHENLKGGRGSSSMAVTAREAWGRTKYHYSLGGHLHGEFTTKEKGGVVAMGSRALSDVDKWHYLNGYIANIRGVQGYVFNKTNGLIATYNGNL